MQDLSANRLTKDTVLYSTETPAPILLWSHVSQPLRKTLGHPQVSHIFLGDQLNERTSYSYLETKKSSHMDHIFLFWRF